MPDGEDIKAKQEEIKKGFFQYAKQWGDNSFPPTVLATLIFSQHAKPFQALPMLFPPVFLLASYTNLQGFKKDAAGISAAWAGLYMLLASRRRYRLGDWFRTRGLIRGATFGFAGMQLVAGSISYAFGKRGKEPGIGEKKVGDE